MKKITIMLLAAATLAISSCTKSSDNSTITSQAPNYYVPYWGNNQQLSGNAGSDILTLNTTTKNVVSNGVTVTQTITSHILYDEQDYIVTNIDSASNSPINPLVYGGHKISISGQGQTYSGTYQVNVIQVGNGNIVASFTLTIDQGGKAAVFGNSIYTGQSATIPNF